MTTNPPPLQYGAPVPKPSNGLGLAGFIVSLVGLLSCGLLAPIGLILSLFGLRKEPKGFAKAGAVIGVLGSVLLVIVAIYIVKGAVGLGSMVGGAVTTMKTASDASNAIVAARTASGSLPSDTEGNAIVGKFIDGWLTPFRYKSANGTYTIISAGMDKKFDTADDLDLSPDQLNQLNQQSGSTSSPAGNYTAG